MSSKKKRRYEAFLERKNKKELDRKRELKRRVAMEKANSIEELAALMGVPLK